MAKEGYVGINNVARKISKGYVGIPTTYTPVEYIESSGTQYIDTGFIPTANTKLDFDAIIVSGNSNTWVPAYGARSYTTSNYVVATYFCLYINSSSYHLSPNYAGFDPGTSGNTTITLGQRYLLTQDKGQFYIDGVLQPNISTTNTITTGDKTLYLFTNNSVGEAQARGQDIKLYGTKIYENDVLVRDFIPVVDNNNVACLYDLIEERAYYNEGSGTFTAGNSTGEPSITRELARKISKGYVGVHKIYTPIEYIENSGTQYIDTSFVPSFSDGFKIEIGFSPSALNNRFCLASNYNETTHISCEITANNEARFFINGGSADIKQSGVILGNNTAIFEYSSGVCKVTCNGNTTTSSTTISGSTVGGLYMFVDRELRFSTFSTPISIDYCKMYSNNTLVRDFVSVLDDNNVACLYDKIDGKAYYNKGAGTFTAGSETSEAPIERDVARLCFAGYIPLNYIESTGTQWIETDVVFTRNTKSQLKFTASVVTGNVLYGYGAGTDNTDYRFFNYNNLFYFDVPGPGTQGPRIFGGSLSLNTIYEIELGNFYIKNLVSGTDIASSAVQTFTNTSNTIKMWYGNGNTSKGKLYYLKIWDGTTLQRDFIPVLDSNGVACLYDYITDAFFYNKGTGTFLYG